jgi:hypothetical protein
MDLYGYANSYECPRTSRLHYTSTVREMFQFIYSSAQAGGSFKDRCDSCHECALYTIAIGSSSYNDAHNLGNSPPSLCRKLRFGSDCGKNSLGRRPVTSLSLFSLPQHTCDNQASELSKALNNKIGVNGAAFHLSDSLDDSNQTNEW